MTLALSLNCEESRMDNSLHFFKHGGGLPEKKLEVRLDSVGSGFIYLTLMPSGEKQKWEAGREYKLNFLDKEINIVPLYISGTRVNLGISIPDDIKVLREKPYRKIYGIN